MPRYCTGSPNFERDTQTCCEQHDKDYSKTSTTPRLEADKKLRACVEKNGTPVRAAVMYYAVRLFGWMFYKGDA